MRKMIVSTVAACVAGLCVGLAAAGTPSADQQRAKLDKMAAEALKKLFEEQPAAKELYNDAYGYAVFHVTKVAVGLTAGGGDGVAIVKNPAALKDAEREKSSTAGAAAKTQSQAGTLLRDRYYMKMGTGGVGIGLGGQQFSNVFLFEDKEKFDNFVHKGWEADAAANAAAGTKGGNRAASFSNGIAVYQLTDKGLIANADISGTKYWINKKLNDPEMKPAEPIEKKSVPETVEPK